MTDSEGGSQSPDGSWQSDPTGRYKLRWQRSSGEWTDHVYSSEGALGSDPYDTPSPPPPPSRAPDRRRRSTDSSQPMESVQQSRKSFGKRLVIAIGIIIGGLIVVSVIGNLIDSGTSAVDTRPTATTSRATTTTPTTTTTSRPASPVTLSGSGQDVTRAVNLTEGRWRVTLTVQGNTDTSFGAALDSNVILSALDSNDNLEYLVNDIASSGSWTSSLTVGSGFGALAPGSVWFEVEGVVRSATWRLTVEPL